MATIRNHNQVSKSVCKEITSTVQYSLQQHQQQLKLLSNRTEQQKYKHKIPLRVKTQQQQQQQKQQQQEEQQPQQQQPPQKQQLQEQQKQQHKQLQHKQHHLQQTQQQLQQQQKQCLKKEKQHEKQVVPQQQQQQQQQQKLKRRHSQLHFLQHIKGKLQNKQKQLQQESGWQTGLKKQQNQKQQQQQQQHQTHQQQQVQQQQLQEQRTHLPLHCRQKDQHLLLVNHNNNNRKEQQRSLIKTDAHLRPQGEEKDQGKRQLKLHQQQQQQQQQKQQQQQLKQKHQQKEEKDQQQQQHQQQQQLRKQLQDHKESAEIAVNVLAETDVNVTSGVVCKEVGLPLRYILTNHTMGQTKKTELDKNSIANDMESREKDISHALKWIQQEMLLMKEQDKLLIRKFIHLRNIIQKLKCTMEKPFSTSDINDVVSFENLSSSLSQISLQEDIFDDIAFHVMDDLQE